MSRKNTLQQIIDYVDKHHPGGKVLSTEYIDSNQKMNFMCENGHTFISRNIGILRKGYWCKKCATQRMVDKRSYSLEEVIEKITELHPGSILLDSSYKNVKTKINIICENSHKFSIPFAHIINHHWCSECIGLKTVTLARITDFINTNHPGSTILSKEVFNNRTKLEIVCEKGHSFNPIAKTVFKGHWCPICAPEKNKKTCLMKYGVEHSSQNKEIALKTAKSSNRSKIKLHWKTNEEMVCIGSYESKSVDYLNKNQIDFEWQPKVFKLLGNKTYRPDLFIIGSNKWIEIKGYFRKDAQEKWNEFQKIQPNSELWDKSKLTSMGVL